jgi:hypothetical protein
MSDEELLPMIFEAGVTTKFAPDLFRLMSTEESQGRGMGLGIVDSIMKGAKGEIRIESRKEAGTKLTFIFEPATTAAALDTPEAAVLALLKDVRSPGASRIFFVPIKDANKTPYDTARADIKYAFEQEGFKNIKIIFYADTETGLDEAVAKEEADLSSEMRDPEALALAYVNANKMSKGAVAEHNKKHPRFKWIREDLTDGVPAEELFMHLAFGLPVLDYVKNSSDPEQRQRLMEIIEKLSGNDRKDLDLVKADFDRLFVSGFVLILKKITRININKEMHERIRTLTQVLTAA